MTSQNRQGGASWIIWWVVSAYDRGWGVKYGGEVPGGWSEDGIYVWGLDDRIVENGVDEWGDKDGVDEWGDKDGIDEDGDKECDVPWGLPPLDHVDSPK